MLKVRLQRVGRRNDPSFRVVVTDSTRGPKSGKYIEMLGSYNPRQKRVALNEDRIKYWMSVGAKVTDTMHNILVKEKITSGKKINVLPKKKPIKKEVAKETTKEKVEVEAEDSQESESEVKEEQKGQSPDEGNDADNKMSSKETEPVRAREAKGDLGEEEEDSKKAS